MKTQVIVLNGGSSSGKSAIVRCLQAVLPAPFLAFAIDTLVDSMPPSLLDSGSGIEISSDGAVAIGGEFRRLEAAWMAGVAATVRAGARVVIDDVFLGGAESQQRWREALEGLDVLWVGVRCDAEVAAGREIGRGDREVGMAAKQAVSVHQGVVYDLEVDSTHTEALQCAQKIVAAVTV